MRNILKSLLLIATVAALISCAAIQPPFASPEEIALKQELTKKLAEYHDLKITVSGDRVYLTGELVNKAELDHVIGVVLETQGVKSVMDDVYLDQSGWKWGERWPPF